MAESESAALGAKRQCQVRWRAGGGALEGVVSTRCGDGTLSAAATRCRLMRLFLQGFIE